jgi:hypothetical protein
LITVDEFKKLIVLEDAGYWIYCGGDQVHHLCYDTEIDPEEFRLPEGCLDKREMCCSYKYVLSHGHYCDLSRTGRDEEWTVMRPEWIDWRKLDGEVRV